MNMAQTTQEKRSIKVKDFLEDFHAGMGDEDLMQKYQLSPVGLEKFYSMLLERSILRSEDFDGRYKMELTQGVDETFTTDQSAFSEEYSTLVESGNLEESGTLTEDLLAAEDPIKPSRPIELPLDEPRDSFFGEEPVSHLAEEPPGVPQSLEEPREFHDPHDEIVSGMPLDYADEMSEMEPETASKCGNCSDELYPGVRKIYDGRRSIMAAIVSAACLLAGFMGAVALTFFNGYSIARLIVIYFTGVSILLGCVLAAVSLFMLIFARERVYACLSCGRVYPRI